jgi:hypothetical protein
MIDLGASVARFVLPVCKEPFAWLKLYSECSLPVLQDPNGPFNGPQHVAHIRNSKNGENLRKEGNNGHQF